jgi:predicted molibdopterin-dependent oxidoreductase YjgC
MNFSDSEKVKIQVDGRWISAEKGQMLTTALISAGIWRYGEPRSGHGPRGPFCGMGVCFECEVNVDKEKHIQACQCMVRNGMVVNTK